MQLPETWADDVPVLMPEGERDFIPFTRSKLVVGATHENDQGYDLQVSSLVEDDLFASGLKLDANLTKEQITQVKWVRVPTRVTLRRSSVQFRITHIFW